MEILLFCAPASESNPTHFVVISGPVRTHLGALRDRSAPATVIFPMFTDFLPVVRICSDEVVSVPLAERLLRVTPDPETTIPRALLD